MCFLGVADVFEAFAGRKKGRSGAVLRVGKEEISVLVFFGAYLSFVSW